MIHLTINKNDKNHLELKEYLENKSLARKIIELETDIAPVLIHGKDRFEGINKIKGY